MRMMTMVMSFENSRLDTNIIIIITTTMEAQIP